MPEQQQPAQKQQQEPELEPEPEGLGPERTGRNRCPNRMAASARRLRTLHSHVVAPQPAAEQLTRQPDHFAGTFNKTLDQGVQGARTDPGRTDTVEVCCIGAGMSGIVTAVELSDAGVDSVLLIDKADDLGGTWHWNKYPGAACDVGSYAYLPYLRRTGFVPSRAYVNGPEIVGHLHTIAQQENLYDKTLLSTRVLSATWDETDGVWRIETDCDDHISAKFLICGNGPLSTPRLPDVEGQDSFAGLSMHTSQWQGNGVDPVRGKRVAVIGTGASGAQVSPEIAKVAEHLYVFQRSAPWCIARGDQPTTDKTAAALMKDDQKRALSSISGRDDWMGAVSELNAFGREDAKNPLRGPQQEQARQELEVRPEPTLPTPVRRLIVHACKPQSCMVSARELGYARAVC